MMVWTVVMMRSVVLHNIDDSMLLHTQLSLALSIRLVNQEA